MRISDPDERSFYKIEAAENNWSVRELNRQFDSALYQRLALSRDKDAVMQLAIQEDLSQNMPGPTPPSWKKLKPEKWRQYEPQALTSILKIENG